MADCLHADFANMYLGGGVLSGGCVQEEIRFAICPELLIGVLLCPVMSEAEAIQIVGAEQFSAYEVPCCAAPRRRASMKAELKTLTLVCTAYTRATCFLFATAEITRIHPSEVPRARS